ncbi:phospholipase D family protein [Treponema saccharophilum]|uniref:PLD phosphodiesterase domain-containing protein n=1 Tax=Treponema saccharophilum DSM 2985 TaxID=907348 RepID=H7EL52_9SPIR|nr:phospholipase D family protein [Treponema saccharophilum]EIC01777.1 hypothetical protein TresaDRAFT_1066 [Treponema saccharophilum DSM 2985]BDC97156.1 hypothetical protein TRSA_22550 [Treponema saccharophilum]
MSLLCSDEILNAIYSELQSAQNSVRIVSAYCKKQVLEKLDSHISNSVSKKQLLLRFRLADILHGSTDFEILDYCAQNKWQVFIRFDLHAKTYIIDNVRGIVGSANMTASGLNLKENGNYEMAAVVPLENSDIAKIDNLFNEAVLITPAILAKMKNELENSKIDSQNGGKQSWSSAILDLFVPTISTLFSHELPESKELPSQKGEYIQFLDCRFNGDLSELKEKFRWCNAYMWLLQVLRKNDCCMYFGQLSAELHNTLVSDPKPFRKDVKIRLSNLLGWCENLSMPEIKIDIPNHSQRIRLT